MQTPDADARPELADAGRPIRLTDAHLAGALDQLLDTRDQLTQVLLGARPPSGPGLAGQVLQQGDGDLAGLGDAGEVRAAPDYPEPGPADA
jgi:hypothetical protein